MHLVPTHSSCRCSAKMAHTSCIERDTSCPCTALALLSASMHTTGLSLISVMTHSCMPCMLCNLGPPMYL